MVILILPAAGAWAQTARPTPDVTEKLGQQVPLDLTFYNEQAQPVALKDLIDKPTVLTLVYYRCPNICSPLLRDLAKVVSQCELVPGTDYDLLTVSFDAREKSDLAKLAGEKIRRSVKHAIPPHGWRFMTGDAPQINQLAEAVGFRFTADGDDFVHSVSVIFLAPDGTITRYLNGLTFLPADLKMAVIDASQGRVRSFIHKIQRLCYSYDPQRNSYIFKVNRIILAVTITFVVVFGAVVLIRGKRNAHDITP